MVRYLLQLVVLAFSALLVLVLICAAPVYAKRSFGSQDALDFCMALGVLCFLALLALALAAYKLPGPKPPPTGGG